MLFQIQPNRIKHCVGITVATRDLMDPGKQLRLWEIGSKEQICLFEIRKTEKTEDCVQTFPRSSSIGASPK
jgi:hypothetical protein